MEDSDEDMMVKVNHARGQLTDLAHSISQLLCCNLYSDVTVVCQNRSYDCHKVK